MTLVQGSTATATALAPKLGYHKAAELAKESFKRGVPVRALVFARSLASR